MPSHRVHKAINRAVLGNDWEIINILKDWPYRLFPGPKHRQFFHDDTTNLILGAIFGPDALLAGFLHDWADNTFIERDGKLYLRSKAPATKKKRPRKRTTKTMFKAPAGKKRKK